MKNLLVTGGYGFIGAHFIRHVLSGTGFNGRIINVDALTYAANPMNLADMEKACPDRLKFVRADVSDGPAMERVFKEYAVDAVCHFAAESHVDRSIDASRVFVTTNVLGTQVLLDLAKNQGPDFCRFHQVSTDEVYGSLGKTGLFTEDSPYRPNSPYAAAKAGADHLVRAYHKTHGLDVTLSHCGNNYGPCQFPEKLIPLVILNALEGKKIPVYGQGTQVRDWIHVTDHCAGIWAVLTKGKPGEAYNIGGFGEKTNLELIQTLLDLVDDRTGHAGSGRGQALISHVRDRPGHDFRYALDPAKISRDLGWEPLESLEQGLEKTVEWYLDNPEWIKSVQTNEYRNWMEKHYD